MIPWVIGGLAIKTVTTWIRSPVMAAWQHNVWEHGCDSWDVNAVLSSSTYITLVETLPNVGTANITSRTGINYSVHLNRHPENHLRFDLQIATNGGSSDPPFSIITYDTQNLTYSAISSFKNTSDLYNTSPNLAFPSLGLRILDESIPFLRPGYDGCWPAAATLVKQNSTTSNYTNILRTLTFDPDEKTRMMVCGMSGDQASDFQIALGVVFIAHYHYSLCITKTGTEKPMGQSENPDR